MERRAQEAMPRAIDVEVAAAENTMAAIIDERTRIARELHDVVAHSVSMMVVQAGAAEQVVEDDPAFARKALATIRSTGTDALTERRRCRWTGSVRAPCVRKPDRPRRPVRPHRPAPP